MVHTQSYLIDRYCHTRGMTRDFSPEHMSNNTVVTGCFCQGVICCSKKWTELSLWFLPVVLWNDRLRKSLYQTSLKWSWEPPGNTLLEAEELLQQTLNVEPGNQGSDWKSTELQSQQDGPRFVIHVWNSLKRVFKKLEDGLEGFDLLLWRRERKQVFETWLPGT